MEGGKIFSAEKQTATSTLSPPSAFNRFIIPPIKYRWLTTLEMHFISLRQALELDRAVSRIFEKKKALPSLNISHPPSVGREVKKWREKGN